MALRIYFPLPQILSVLLLIFFVIDQTTPFTIKLLHRYSPESPFYNTNFTKQGLIESLNFKRKTRKQLTSLSNSSPEENRTLLDLQTIRPLIYFDIHYSAFLVKVSLGTFSNGGPSHKSYYLDLDTGSDLTWLQCEDCMRERNQCYRQIELPFPNSKSSSYRPVPCERYPHCFPNGCIEGSCSYYIKYADDSHSYGILALENFVFPSTNGHKEIIPIVFGCGIHNERSYGKDISLKMAGIFGLGRGRHSFVTQTNSISQGRFSYCLPPESQAAQGLAVFLRFGSDIPSYSFLPRTRLIEYQDDCSYYVNLLGMSINGARLNIPSMYFRKGGHNVGGCHFDTGFLGIRISMPAFQIVKKAMERHIVNSITSIELVGPMFGFESCYRAPKPFTGRNNLPSITFHFEGNANLVVKPNSVFYYNYDDVHHEYICLAILPGKKTVIGSNAQANQFIVYDLHEHNMYFGPRDCSGYP